MHSSEPHTVIIGNGIAGVTTARHLRKHDARARITIVSGETPYFFSRTALMYVYMGHMPFENTKPYEDHFWPKNRIDLVQQRVRTVHFDARTLAFEGGGSLQYDKLVLATGSKPAFFGWEGQHLAGVQGLYSYQDLQLLEANTPAPGQKNHPCKQAVVVGGGLIGIELAEMLLSRGVKVTMLVRENHFWGNVITQAESERIEAHAQSHGLEIWTSAELDRIEGTPQGKVAAIHTRDGRSLACQLVGITTGVQPNVDFLRDTALHIGRGILVNDYLETNIHGVYAAGDCAEVQNPTQGRRAIEPVWYTGRMMGETLGATLAGKRTAYNPGPWFNSAKFFDIEYQTYGLVHPLPSATHRHWHTAIPGNNRFVTVAYHPETLHFQGINAFGIRLRHSYFHDALIRNALVTDVLGSIEKAAFDAEFTAPWHPQLKNNFVRDTGLALPARRSVFNKWFKS